MDEGLIEQLREHCVMPLELDTALQEYYIIHGIDWAQLETLFSPQEHIDLCEQVEDNVRTLYGLEFEGKVGTPEYQRLEAQIQEQLQGLISLKISKHATNLTRLRFKIPLGTPEIATNPIDPLYHINPII